MALHGTLEDFSSAGILRVLSFDGRTGVLRFDGDTGCAVFLDHGQLYLAVDATTDATLAAALVRPGRVSAKAWSEAIEEAGDQPIVGELLVRRGAIHPDLLASVVLSIAYDPLISLFRTGQGDFEFEPGATHWLGPFRVFSVDVIVAEVRRRVREVDEWVSVMPSLDVWVSARRTLPVHAVDVTLQRDEWELITALTEPRSIDELADDLGRGRYATARVVFGLSRAGLVDVNCSRLGAKVLQLRPVA
jgi:hypothetical protein